MTMTMLVEVKNMRMEQCSHQQFESQQSANSCDLAVMLVLCARRLLE